MDKKFLYESIMSDVSQIIKKHLNEANIQNFVNIYCVLTPESIAFVRYGEDYNEMDPSDRRDVNNLFKSWGPKVISNFTAISGLNISKKSAKCIKITGINEYNLVDFLNKLWGAFAEIGDPYYDDIESALYCADGFGGLQELQEALEMNNFIQESQALQDWIDTHYD